MMALRPEAGAGHAFLRNEAKAVEPRRIRIQVVDKLGQMGEQDLFVLTEAEVEVDVETAAAIELGIADVREGRTVSHEETT
jgi:hypothetical protein